MPFNYAAFILSHGRGDNLVTIPALRDKGYTGEIYVVIDNHDDPEPYQEACKNDHLLIFNQEDYYDKNLTFDNDPSMKTPIFARHAIFDFAKNLNYEYFVMLEDDYNSFGYRSVYNGSLLSRRVLDLDFVFNAYFQALIDTDADCLAAGQDGELIGGKDTKFITCPVSRKCMNTYFFRTDRPMTFCGRFNDDINAAVANGRLGKKIFTYHPFVTHQLPTQSIKGGMTELYSDNGTYVKTMYSVMAFPTNFVVTSMGVTNRRIHHNVQWSHSVPMIIDEKWKKVD